MLWSLLRLDTKILKEARGDPSEAYEEARVIKDRRIIIVLSCFLSYFVILYLIFMIFMPGSFQNLAVIFFKGLTQNFTQKLKVKIQFYVDSENFRKKY